MSRFGPSTAGSTNESVLALVTLMSNPEEFKQKLAEMTALQASLDEKIALAGQADQILHLKEQIVLLNNDTAALNEKAKELYDQALADGKRECERLIADAGVQSAEIVEQARQVRVKALEDADQIIAKANVLKDQAVSDAQAMAEKAAQKEQQLQALERDIEERNASCAAREQWLDVRDRELALKKEQLDSLTELNIGLRDDLVMIARDSMSRLQALVL